MEMLMNFNFQICDPVEETLICKVCLSLIEITYFISSHFSTT
ncbi:unnamed protein product, partial [Vitis vinifera]|uniref:Uncharacterized protein n=1 Tax=Vitis vinifera TaxID=29760 RepID=E0CQY2_VITVI